MQSKSLFDQQDKLEQEELEALTAHQAATAALIRVKRQKHKLRMKAKKVLAREAVVLREQEMNDDLFPDGFDFPFVTDLGESEPVLSPSQGETSVVETSP